MKTKIYSLVILFIVLLSSCELSKKNNFSPYEEKFGNLIHELDSLKQYFENFNIDSTTYLLEEIDSICQTVNCDSLMKSELEFKELNAIHRFFNYYLQQYSNLKKELVSSYENINSLKNNLDKGKLNDSIIQAELEKERVLIRLMEIEFSLKFKDLQQHYENYLNRYKKLMNIFAENKALSI